MQSQFMLFVALMIVWGFIEGARLDESSSFYSPPVINSLTGRRTTKLQAWIGRMIGDALWLFVAFVVINFIVGIFN